MIKILRLRTSQTFRLKELTRKTGLRALASRQFSVKESNQDTSIKEEVSDSPAGGQNGSNGEDDVLTQLNGLQFDSVDDALKFYQHNQPHFNQHLHFSIILGKI
jgi:hypothetical protein